jgi:cytochrome b
MPPTADPQTPTTTPAHAPARTAAGIRRRACEQFADNPLQAVFSTAIVALLIFNYTTLNFRISDTNDRITRFEDKVDAQFAALEEDVAEINLKLTALIAALNRTEEVDAAIEGRLLDPTRTPVPDGAPTG